MAKVQKKKTPLIAWIVLIAFLSVIGTVIWNAYSAERKSNHSFMLDQTCELVANFMEKNQGQWPKSWDDLCQDNSCITLSNSITVDFRADPKELVNIDPDNFDAIRTKGKSYGHGPKFEKLIATIRKYHGNSTPQKNEPTTQEHTE